MSSKHIPALDGLRGLAILMVMLFHFTSPDLIGNSAAATAFTRIAGYGGAGVNLFFVLSGFLITGILYDSKTGSHYFRNFYMRRVLRIFPLYYGTLFLLLVLLPAVRMPSDEKFQFTVHNQIWLWAYCSNIFETLHDRAMPLLGHFWSLAVEEHFYFVWPVIVLLFSRKALLRVCIGCIVLAFLVRLSLLYAGADPAVAVLRLTPCQVDSLAVGCGIALLVRGGSGFESLIKPARCALGLRALLLIASFTIFPKFFPDSFFIQSAEFTIWALAFGGLLALTLSAASGAPLAVFFSHRLMRVIGKYSYALYIFHWPIGRILLPFFDPQSSRQLFGGLSSGAIVQLSYYAAAGGAAFIAAWLSWHLYEKRFLKLKRFFDYESDKRQPSPNEAFSRTRSGTSSVSQTSSPDKEIAEETTTPLTIV